MLVICQPIYLLMTHFLLFISRWFRSALCLREFGISHLATLDISFHADAARLLAQIAKNSRIVETSRTCLRCIISILEVTILKADVWEVVYGVFLENDWLLKGFADFSRIFQLTH